jgi:RES domain
MADAARPHPPPLKGSPALRQVQPATWWRVHRFSAMTGRYAPQEFNDSGLGNARFSPLQCENRVIPTLYAAATLEGALMETVLHDVPYPSQGHIHDLERDLGSDLRASAVQTTVPLQLVDLTKIGLQRMGLRVSALFETDADDYARTREWAQWLHAALQSAQGLYWMAARQPECAAMMLFGDRVPHGALRPGDAPPRHLGEPAVLSCLLSLLDRLGCGVASNR